MEMNDLLQGEGVAISLENGEDIRYSDLRKRVHERVDNWCRVWSAEELNHQPVVIQECTPLEQIVSVFASFMAGMVVNIDGDPTLIHSRWICSDGELHPTNLEPRLYGNGVNALFLTSGTTAPERIVGHRQKSLLTCAREMSEVLAVESVSRVALTLDLSFHYGFSVMTSTFSVNATLLLSTMLPKDPLFVFHLNGWLQNSRPTVLATVPQGWELFYRTLSEVVWDAVDVMVSAGDLMPTELLNRLTIANSTGKIHILYGSTEVLRSCHRLWDYSDDEGCIGTALPSVKLTVEDGVTLQSGATLFEELWEEDRCALRQMAWPLQDSLRVDESGAWYFLHRSTDSLKVSGKRVSPLLIERCLTVVEGVDDAVVVEHEGCILAILCVPVIQDITTIEVEIPKQYQPKRWVVLHESFPLTPRYKRSRQWIKSYALRHFTPASTPPIRLVSR